ncbi:MAG: VapE domain-containing protein [Bacteroidota bacterium]
MNLSIFQNFTTITENKPFTDILTDIKTGKYRGPVTYIRKCLQEQKLDSYEKAKKGLLAFTPSGQFEGGRNQDTLKKYSGIIVLDFDKLNPEQLKKCRESVMDDSFTLAVFISPSGNGLKVFVQTQATPSTHKNTFLHVQAYYESLSGLSIDKSGKDYTRLCFMSLDPDLYHNPNSQVFTNTHNSKTVIEESLPLPAEREPEGEVKPKTIPQQDFLKIYHDSIKLTENKEFFTTGNRNNFVHLLACNLNRKGVPFAASLGFILADYNFDEKEVMAAVNSAYKNTSEHAIKREAESPPLLVTERSRSEERRPGGEVLPSIAVETSEDEEPRKRIPAIDRVENFLLLKYRFRNNTITGRLEYRFITKKVWHQVNDYIENSMLRELLKNKVRTNMSGLRNLLYSDFCELFNPFTTYFESLPDWDEQTDYIAQLAETITTTHQELWHTCFKKWLVAMVGCVLDEHTINQTVIVFSGKQGVGKTTWMENLIPTELKQYLFSGTINPNNKDTLIHLSECMLINLDELENLNRSEIGSLKELITKTHIRIRRAYGHNNETLPRCASFAGSVNTAQFLNDTTGSRRFLSFEVTDIKYDHRVSLNDVYAQALQLFKSGFRFWFNRDEIGAINQNNEQYQLRSPEEELLLTWFESCTKENANAFLTASQILAKLADKAKINVSDSSVNKLGKALIKNNYLRFKSNGKLLYALRELQWEEVESRNRSMIEEFSGNAPGIESNSPAQHIEIQGDLPFNDSLPLH